MSPKKLDDAIARLTQIIAAEDYLHRIDAAEMLGLARERKGQLAQAKAAYEDYLRRYPDSRAAAAHPPAPADAAHGQPARTARQRWWGATRRLERLRQRVAGLPSRQHQPAAARRCRATWSRRTQCSPTWMAWCADAASASTSPPASSVGYTKDLMRTDAATSCASARPMSSSTIASWDWARDSAGSRAAWPA